jgi:hypothetical protein
MGESRRDADTPMDTSDGRIYFLARIKPVVDNFARFFEKWGQMIITLAGIVFIVGIGVQRLNNVEVVLSQVRIEGSLPTIQNSKDIAVLQHVVNEHVRVQEIQFGRIEGKLDHLAEKGITDLQAEPRR